MPSGAIFALNEIGREILDEVSAREQDRPQLVERLLDQGYSVAEIRSALRELEEAGALSLGDAPVDLPKVPARSFPLQRIVLNVTNQCNLACGYCYEYSEDKISKTANKPKNMNHQIAEAAVDLLFRESGDHPSVHVTFFGGETLLNFPLLRSTVDYARKQAASANKRVEFSLTTNATLLTETIVDFLAEQRVGVTVSIDGDREMNDRMRVFHDGRGSYDVIVPKIRLLLERHRTNSIGARVTLSAGVAEIRRIYDHLTREVGFKAVGFSPATANPSRLYSIGPQKMSSVLGGFEEL
ncbi:MAG: radical SAM protein, partial [Anaerolineae bacterium]|nr:radical SAM protein [Gemmatimonadaceae bacterium]